LPACDSLEELKKFSDNKGTPAYRVVPELNTRLMEGRCDKIFEESFGKSLASWSFSDFHLTPDAQERRRSPADAASFCIHSSGIEDDCGSDLKPPPLETFRWN
jgi:hypothetical protein